MPRRKPSEPDASAPKRSRRLAPAEQAAPSDWKPRIRSREQLLELVERLPSEPGVYIMRDRKGRIVYVGKARKLKARVRQYFNGHDTRLFVPMLEKLLGDIEAVVTSNDKEAMLLENNLIKQHHPRFNVKLRDDKQYLVLRLDPRAAWPKLEVVRNIAQDHAQYFGPYHSATSARHTLRVVNRHFKLRTCSDFVLDHRKRPCLQYQIGRCDAPCVYEVDPEQYAEQVRDVGLFLAGRHRELVAGLGERMEAAAGALAFEQAARIRDQLRAIETTLERQQIVGTDELDQDVVGMYREGGNVEFVVMHVRQGKLLGTQRFAQSGMELPDAEVLHGFLTAYYDDAPLIPDEVLLPFALADDDLEPLQDHLGERRGRKVAIKLPARGDRKKLVLLAERNAASNFATRRSKRDDAEQALERLRERLRLSRLPRRMECFDISHIQGSDPVASMVVFVDGQPDKASYRSFKVKPPEVAERDRRSMREPQAEGLGERSEQGRAAASAHLVNDDFAAMYETLTRRLRRAIDDEDWALPDLLIIDGGKGQLGRVITAMQDLGIALGEEGCDVVALAKERSFAPRLGKQGLEQLRASGSKTLADYVVARADDTQSEPSEPASGESKPERVFVPGAKDAIALAKGSSELYLMTRIRDEAHRFAITHHRKRRGKRSLESALDGIKGVGPAIKRALVQHFGTVKAIREASVEQLAAVEGVGPKLAERIRAGLSA